MANLLSNYREFAAGNEAHENYHIWSALSAVSSIVSRKVWVPLGDYFNIYANLYVVLVGPPGAKKTTAMNIAKGLVRKVGGIPFSAQAQTKESLVLDILDAESTFKVGEERYIYTPMSIFITELSHFLGPNSAHMIDFLTTIYDQDFYDVKTKNKGSQGLQGPFITILGCTTPRWITNYLKADIISGGFSRRCVFVNEDDEDHRIAFPKVTPEMSAAWDSVLKEAERIKAIKGEFTWAPEAAEFFEHWYNTMVLPDDENVRWYFKTKHVQLLKVAMLVSVCESSDLVLTKTNLEVALALLARVEVKLPKLFQGVGRNVLSPIKEKVMDLLEKSGGSLTEKKIMRLMYSEADQRELASIVAHLISTDRVKKCQLSSDGVKRIYLMTPEKFASVQALASDHPILNEPLAP